VALKLTKTELRLQQIRLNQLKRYLPTLQLKKAMLQAEVQEVRQEIVLKEERFAVAFESYTESTTLLCDPLPYNFDQIAKPSIFDKHYENIAGVEVPFLDRLEFETLQYNLYDTPIWLDGLIEIARTAKRALVEVEIAREKKKALEEELRSVTTRVNLFEKILIPRTEADISKIRIFLGDQQLAAVCRAKVAKRKILM
jgi:H(+)-transporting ATP synthase, vacuolar type, subunit D